MVTRTFIGKGGETWEWEETPETIEAIKKLHETAKKVNDQEQTSKN